MKNTFTTVSSSRLIDQNHVRKADETRTATDPVTSVRGKQTDFHDYEVEKLHGGSDSLQTRSFLKFGFAFYHCLCGSFNNRTRELDVSTFTQTDLSSKRMLSYAH